jgi:hypothetical protein
MLAAETSASKTDPGPHSRAVFDTDKGAIALDIDAYFTPPAGGFKELPPLLLPSPGNIAALREHISATMPAFLAQHNIPAPPARIEYDTQGKMQLPNDYAYADAFQKALESHPALDRQLHTVAALTSHQVEMAKSLPFQRDYAAASSPAEVEAVIAKYSHLFSNSRHYATIALNFSDEGALSLSADGVAIS